MNVSPNSIPSNAKLFFSLKEGIVHRFFEKEKATISEGTCEILHVLDEEDTPNDEKVYYLKVDKFVQAMRNSHILVRINYAENTTYLFESSDGKIISVSFNVNNEDLHKFEQHFSQFSVILEFASENISEELKKKIQDDCPEDIQTRDITIDGKLYMKKIGSGIGSAIGLVSSYLQKPAQNAGNAIGDRATTFTRDSVSEETKTKWNGVVEKSKSINDKMTEVVKPVMNKYNQFADSIGQKFNTSQNKVVKTIRDYSMAFANSVNDSEKRARTGEGESNLPLKDESSQIQLK